MSRSAKAPDGSRARAEPGERVTFVLPLHGARDVESTRMNLLPSLERFFKPEDVEEILVIGRSGEYRGFAFDDVLSKPLAQRVRTIDERELLPRRRSLLPLKGYDKQQVLKLTVSARVRTRLYCTLDADVYLVRPCGLGDWWSGGKCVYNPVSMDVYPRWWRAAAKHLGYRTSFDRSRGFSVTPALLYTHVAAEAVDYLETKRKGVAHAVRHRATEYSLYWLYLLENYDSAELYTDERPHLLGRPAWRASDIGGDGVRAFVDRQFRPGEDYFFSLLQSTSGVVDRSVLEYIRQKIDAGVPSSAA